MIEIIPHFERGNENKWRRMRPATSRETFNNLSLSADNSWPRYSFRTEFYGWGSIISKLSNFSRWNILMGTGIVFFKSENMLLLLCYFYYVAHVIRINYFLLINNEEIIG